MSLDQHAQAGIAAINDDRYDDAIRELSAALAIDGSRPDLNNLLGMVYLRRGDVGNAVPYLERAVELAAPYDAPQHQEMKREFHMALASAYALLDRVADAASVLRESLELWPQNAKLHLQLGQLLLGSCQTADGVRVYRDALSVLDPDRREAGEALVGAIELLLEHEDEDGEVFLKAHQAEYVRYFDEVVAGPETEGWPTEAAYMTRKGGELVPILREGARPYALTREDLVNPADNKPASVYSEQDPMIVQVEGLEPLAQVPVLFPWRGWGFEVWVCSHAPWHWLTITVQFDEAGEPETLVDRIDEVVGSWYLDGFNGEFGTKEKGRFHFVTDPEVVGDRAVSYTVDLGRARYEAIGTLMRRLVVLHDKHVLRRVVFGRGRLPD